MTQASADHSACACAMAALTTELEIKSSRILMPLCCADAVAALITKLGTESSRLLTALFCVGAVAARLRVYDLGIC